MEGGSVGNQALRGPDLSRGGAVSREALLQAQASYAELMLEIREQAPRHAALVAPEAATWRDVADAPGAGPGVRRIPGELIRAHWPSS